MEEDRLELYDKIIEKCGRFKRKGKSMPYTSANGHMFADTELIDYCLGNL
ncbi:MAG: hypothetical protein AAF039_13460 [Bacteroidota bacterium]